MPQGGEAKFMRSRSVSVQVQVTNQWSHLKGLLESAQLPLQARGGRGGHTANHTLPQMDRKTLIEQILLNDSSRYALNAQVPQEPCSCLPEVPLLPFLWTTQPPLG